MSETPTPSVLDRPNSYIGRSVPRPNIRNLLEGRATFVDDIRLPRMVHVAFARSPYAHAQIVSIDTDLAGRSPGVIAVVDGAELAEYCTPWVGVLSHLEGLKSPPQHAIAIDRACWQGEAVAAVVAESRAEAEDAVERIGIRWKELPVVADMETALDRDTAVIHPELGDNLAWRREFSGVDTAPVVGVLAYQGLKFLGLEADPLCQRTEHSPITGVL